MIRKSLPILLPAALLVAICSTAVSLAGPPPDPPIPPEPFPSSDIYPAEIILTDAEMLSTLTQSGVDVGNLRPLEPGRPFPRQGEPFEPLVATVYVNPGEARRLEQQGLAVTPIPNESLRAARAYGPGSGAPNAWPTYEDWVTRMEVLSDTYPSLVRLVSIGQSVQGRDIWVLKITDNPDVEEDEPEFEYTSTMHGNEAVGTEMTLRLAELLTTNYYDATPDPSLVELVDEMEIWLCPIYNPDGYVANSRNNANDVNLNRDFPDRITDPVDDPAGREPETQVFMNFGYERRFVMGANYHTGALVVNYPWDSIPLTADYAPDDALYYDYSVEYAKRNPAILGGGFPNGVTRGWEWYVIRGGLQDWAYHWRGEHHVTIEISDYQPPPYEQMDAYWDDNREAMLWWMRRALTGARGLVTDANTGDPLDASVDVEQIGKPVPTDPDVGDYHRLLLPGTYTVTASAHCYLDQAAQVTVVSGTATIQHFQLSPAPQWTVEGTVTDADTGLPLEATIEIAGTTVVTQSNPTSGHYTTPLCQGTYTMAVSAPLHRSEERVIAVSGDQVQDFALEPAPCTLLVDDDEEENYQTYYEGALTAAGEVYDLWTVASRGSPTATDLASYRRIIWLTGDDYNSTLTPSDQSALAAFLDNGGRLFVSGQDIGYDIDTSLFYADYLHAQYLSDDTNDTTLSGLDFLTDADITIEGGDGADNQDFPSRINPYNDGTAIYDYSSSIYGGVAYSGTYRVVYFAFGFEGINNQADRTEVMSRTLAWLGGCGDTVSPGVTLITSASDQTALPGRDVAYQLTVTNTGNITDTYSLTLTGAIWPTMINPTQTVPLHPWQAADVWVEVTIPEGAAGETDTVTVKATSDLDALVYAEQTLVTLRAWGLMLPLVSR